MNLSAGVGVPRRHLGAHRGLEEREERWVRVGIEGLPPWGWEEKSCCLGRMAPSGRGVSGAAEAGAGTSGLLLLLPSFLNSFHKWNH